MPPVLATVLLPGLLLTACSGGPEAPGLPAGAEQLSADGAVLRPVREADPGPEGTDPPCAAFAARATCTRVGDAVYVVQAGGGGWRLTEYDVDDELARWVPGLQGTGQGPPPSVTPVDLTPATQPEALVASAGSYDLVGTGDAGVPAVLAHGEGPATVRSGQVVVGDRRVQQVGGRWLTLPLG